MTGYVVHYSDGVTNMTESVPASSTSSHITNLTNCYNYTFSVETLSEHLSGLSKKHMMELGTTNYNNCKITTVVLYTKVLFITLFSNSGRFQLAVDVTAEAVSSTVISVKWDYLRACSQVDNDSSGVDNDSSRVDNDSSRVDNDSSRVDNDSSQVDNDSSQVDNDSSQVDNDRSQVEKYTSVNFTVQYTDKSSDEGGNNINLTAQLFATTIYAQITELMPYTNYSIKVAVVNEMGDMGPYSYPLTVQTLEDGKKIVLSKRHTILLFP